MDRESLIELTKNLYRLTLLFPKKEPLRFKIRELADEILANFLRAQNTKKTEDGFLRLLGEELEVLDSFFEVAKAQNWVSPGVLLAIQQEYSKIKESLNDVDREEPAFAPPSLKFRRAGKASAGKKEIAGTERIEENEENEAVLQYPFFQDQEKINPVRNRASNGVGAAAISNGVNERQRRILEILREREKLQVWELKAVFPQVTKRTLRRDFEQMFKGGLIERIGEKNDTYYQLKPFLSEDR